jgi:hypothetical protein
VKIRYLGKRHCISYNTEQVLFFPIVHLCVLNSNNVDNNSFVEVRRNTICSTQVINHRRRSRSAERGIQWYMYVVCHGNRKTYRSYVVSHLQKNPFPMVKEDLYIGVLMFIMNYLSTVLEYEIHNFSFGLCNTC